MALDAPIQLGSYLIEALIGAVCELGRLTETPTPHIDSVYACVNLLNKTLGDQRGRLEISQRNA